MLIKDKKIVIFGSGGHAKSILAEILKDNEFKVLGFIDEDKPRGTRVESYNRRNFEVISNISTLSDVIDENTYGVIGVGLNYLRKSIANEVIDKCPSFKWAKIISKDSIINGNVEIGDGTVIMSASIINTGTVLGEHCIINTRTILEHDNKFRDFTSTGPDVTTGGNVIVDHCSHIGLGAKINNNIKIAENTIIGSKSLCTKNCEANSVYMGTPAQKQKIREYDEDYL